MRIQKGDLRVNGQIRAREVRLVLGDGKQAGVVSLTEALKAASESGMDLVEIAAAANPPVCRVLDYSKYRYEQEKQDRETRQHQKQHIKELRFRPQIDEHDYQTKLRSLLKFIKRGDKVKVTLVYRGREMTHQEFGVRLLERLREEISQFAVVERAPIQEGRFVYMTVIPK